MEASKASKAESDANADVMYQVGVGRSCADTSSWFVAKVLGLFDDMALDRKLARELRTASLD